MATAVILLMARFSVRILAPYTSHLLTYAVTTLDDVPPLTMAWLRMVGI
jgi:hypothetical protein